MIDQFALLDEPRRPWLDPQALKAKFLALSAGQHPDRVHDGNHAQRQAAQERFTDINAAYNCLRDPKERLRHLLELECGGKPKEIQNIPAGLLDLFVEVGQACRDVNAFLAEKAKVTSPMLKVGQFECALEWTDRLQGLQQTLKARQDALLDELKTLNAHWDAAPALGSTARPPALPLEHLEEIYRVLSFLNRWTAQLQERLVQLSF
jgi:DnaJ-domain-containing protein 1